MSSLSKRHRDLDERGVGKCSVPMWIGGCPGGFCDKPAFGKPPLSREYYNHCSGQHQREDGRYNGYVPGLACIGHGGPRVRTYMDGNAWCAVKPDFINLQESIASFGTTRDEAIAALGVSP